MSQSELTNTENRKELRESDEDEEQVEEEFELIH